MEQEQQTNIDFKKLLVKISVHLIQNANEQSEFQNISLFSFQNELQFLIVVKQIFDIYVNLNENKINLDYNKLLVNQKSIVVLNIDNLQIENKETSNLKEILTNFKTFISENIQNTQFKDKFLEIWNSNFLDCQNFNNKYDVNDKFNKIVNEKYDQLKNEEFQNLYFQHLMLEARKVRENAYCKYSNFQVGTVLVDQDNNTYGGVNVENASYGLTLCGERVAVQNAVSNGMKKIKYICTQANTGEPKNPCGACRDVIGEFASDKTVIIFSTLQFEYRLFNMSYLMPHYSSNNVEIQNQIKQ